MRPNRHPSPSPPLRRDSNNLGTDPTDCGPPSTPCFFSCPQNLPAQAQPSPHSLQHRKESLLHMALQQVAAGCCPRCIHGLGTPLCPRRKDRFVTNGLGPAPPTPPFGSSAIMDCMFQLCQPFWEGLGSWAGMAVPPSDRDCLSNPGSPRLGRGRRPYYCVYCSVNT